jgi:L-fuculose-phosphate aldolase/L-ribulose-5-phosphate 4-epimerase
MDTSEVLRTKQAVVAAAQRAFHGGLQSNVGGNLSARIPGADACVIKATGMGFAECTVENLSVVGLDGRLLEGGQPTSDVAIHLAIYQRRPDVHGIAHAHTPWATGWAAAGLAPPPVTVTAHAKLGPVPLIPLAPGGGTQTDAEIVAAMGDSSLKAAILEQHGALACGCSILEAIHLLELVEENAHIAAVRAIVLALPTPSAHG